MASMVWFRRPSELQRRGDGQWSSSGIWRFCTTWSGFVNLPKVPCTFVVLDNAGGGIFSFLPQAAVLPDDRFELLFGTPPVSDLSSVARGFGLEVHEVTTRAEMEAALNATAGTAAPALVRVRVGGRKRNVALHDAINRAVADALA